MSGEGKRLSMLGHIGELRKRLIRSLVVVGVAAIVCFIFREQIINLLIAPAQGIQLQAIEMTEMLGTIMRVSLFAAIILAMPYLTYEVIMFVSPALTRREKMYVYLILPWIALMFIGGVLFSYYVLVPNVTKFLLTFGSDIAPTVPRIKDYINVVTRMMLAVGLVFEMPVVTTFLARIGVLKYHWLARKRREAIIVSFILAALITPTIDPINQALVAVPLVVLYEMSIWLARLAQKRRPAAE
ncbi:MAG: twin-arginine translocase subunit TatC [Dehalococcoidales bacterium]